MVTSTPSVTAGYLCSCCNDRLVMLVDVGPLETRTLLAVCPTCDYAGQSGPVPLPQRPERLRQFGADRWALE